MSEVFFLAYSGNKEIVVKIPPAFEFDQPSIQDLPPTHTPIEVIKNTCAVPRQVDAECPAGLVYVSWGLSYPPEWFKVSGLDNTSSIHLTMVSSKTCNEQLTNRINAPSKTTLFTKWIVRNIIEQFRS